MKIMQKLRHIWLVHPETVEPLLNSNAHISKSIDYEPLLPWLGTGLLLSTGEKWHKRRLIAHVITATNTEFKLN